MTIGEAADRVGVSTKAIRLWESRGLIPAAERTAAGYRLFTDTDLTILRFIRQAKTLGLTLTEVKEILDAQKAGRRPCERVSELLDTRMAQIDHAVDQLRQLRRTMTTARELARTVSQDPTGAFVCRIIEKAGHQG